MQLDDIFVFLQVVESGSLSRAAKLLGRPKASVSHNLRRLEQNLGAPLLDREKNAIILNDAGRVFLDRARAIATSCEAATDEVRASLAAQSGQIRIASTSEFASNIMSSIFMDFAEGRLDLNIRAMTHPHEVLSELRMQYDCIIHIGAPQVEDFPDMTQTTLGHFSYQWFAAPEYLSKRPRPKHPTDLERCKLLVQLGRNETQIWHASNGSEHFKLTPNPAFTSNDPWIVKLAAVHGRGICFMPTFFARQEVAAGMLAPVLPDWSSEKVGVYALYWAHRYANPNLAFLLERAAANFDQIDHYLYRASSP